jgi:hypothetical protein
MRARPRACEPSSLLMCLPSRTTSPHTSSPSSLHPSCLTSHTLGRAGVPDGVMEPHEPRAGPASPRIPPPHETTGTSVFVCALPAYARAYFPLALHLSSLHLYQDLFLNSCILLRIGVSDGFAELHVVQAGPASRRSPLPDGTPKRRPSAPSTHACKATS